jgi:hypothetical protein
MNQQHGENDFVCDKCNGTGKQKEKYFLWIGGYGYDSSYSYKCLKCHGKGYLDWIERIVGKSGSMEYIGSDIIVISYEEYKEIGRLKRIE